MRLGESHKTLGVLFVCLVLAGVYLTYGVFTKKFTEYDELILSSPKLGLQLPIRADVKTRGVIVGEVLDVRADADGAVLTLGIFPEKLGTIPANVTGSILPKTLFGEKYVSLEIPESGPEGTMRAGATIARTEVSIEVEKVLFDLYPLLRAVSSAGVHLLPIAGHRNGARRTSSRGGRCSRRRFRPFENRRKEFRQSRPPPRR